MTVTRVFDNRIRDLLVIWFCCVQVQQQQQQQQQEEDDETLVPNSDLPEGPQPMEGKLLSVFFFLSELMYAMLVVGELSGRVCETD